MKTTLDIPDELFRHSKAAAALRGQSLKQFVTAALRSHLERQGLPVATRSGWRSVFGRAQREEIQRVDAFIQEEFESVDPGEWR